MKVIWIQWLNISNWSCIINMSSFQMHVDIHTWDQILLSYIIGQEKLHDCITNTILNVIKIIFFQNTTLVPNFLSSSTYEVTEEKGKRCLMPQEQVVYACLDRCSLLSVKCNSIPVNNAKATDAERTQSFKLPVLLSVSKKLENSVPYWIKPYVSKYTID